MERMVVLGASPNPERFSYRAVRSLIRNGYDVVAIGLRNGVIDGIAIHTDRPKLDSVHTILLYVGPKNQAGYFEYIVNLKPKRVIFNPGTENPELINLLERHKIEACFDCALIMLNSNTF